MTWILAIDLGNGGPKVAAVTPQGEILATAFHPVSVQIGRDGTATQDAIEWEMALGVAMIRLTSDQVDSSRAGSNARRCQRLLMKSVLRVARMSSKTALTRGLFSGLAMGAMVDMGS